MRSVKNARAALPNFFQKNNLKGVISPSRNSLILSITDAYREFKWVKQYFDEKPEKGFFIWIKDRDQVSTLAEINTLHICQKLNNLIVVDKGVSANLFSTCFSDKGRLGASHFAQSRIVLRKEASLQMRQRNVWNKGDVFETDYRYFLEEGSELELKVLNIGENTKASTKEQVFLNGKNSQANVSLKIVAKDKSDFFSETYICGDKKSRGYIDCQGMIIDKESKIFTIPGLFSSSGECELKHEASIGRISAEQLNYLRTRGIKEKRAIELIINGFLNS